MPVFLGVRDDLLEGPPLVPLARGLGDLPELDDLPGALGRVSVQGVVLNLKAEALPLLLAAGDAGEGDGLASCDTSLQMENC